MFIGIIGTGKGFPGGSCRMQASTVAILHSILSRPSRKISCSFILLFQWETNSRDSGVAGVQGAGVQGRCKVNFAESLC